MNKKTDYVIDSKSSDEQQQFISIKKEYDFLLY